MDMIIGRDGQTSQLNVAIGQKIYRFFPANSVPTDVSRQHCLVTTLGDGKYKIRNIKAANVTYVNGIEIEEGDVSDADRIELGRGRYLLDLSHIIGKLAPQQKPQKVVDITPLQKIWDEYNAQDVQLQKHQKNIGLLASVPMGFTMLGTVISSLSETVRPYAIGFTVIALVIMVYGFYKRYTDKTIERRQQLKVDFQQKYICPNPECRRFLGMTAFVSLQSKGNCPYCKAKYKTLKQPQS